MTRIELAGLMLGLLAVSVAGGISWRLFRPHRGAHVYDLAPVPIPRLEYGSMILEEETRLRGDWQDAYIRALAPEVLAEEAPVLPWIEVIQEEPLEPIPDLPRPEQTADMAAGADNPGSRDLGPGRPDLISMMSDEDFFHMARFEFRRLEWMASEPLTLPAWTGRAA